MNGGAAHSQASNHEVTEYSPTLCEVQEAPVTDSSSQPLEHEATEYSPEVEGTHFAEGDSQASNHEVTKQPPAFNDVQEAPTADSDPQALKATEYSPTLSEDRVTLVAESDPQALEVTECSPTLSEVQEAFVIDSDSQALDHEATEYSHALNEVGTNVAESDSQASNHETTEHSPTLNEDRVTFVAESDPQALDHEVTEHSPALDSSVATQPSRLERLPKYLTVHMDRLKWGEQRSKITVRKLHPVSTHNVDFWYLPSEESLSRWNIMHWIL